MSDFPTVQGQYVSWAEMAPTIQILDGNSIQTRDYKAVEWDDNLVPGKIRGTGPYMIGRTVGEYDANASISMYYASAIIMQESLAAVNSKIGLAVFDMPISWTPLDGIGDVYSVRLVGCRITKRGIKAAPGTDGQIMEMPLSIVRVAFYDRLGNELVLV